MGKIQSATSMNTVEHDNKTTKVTEYAEPIDEKERQPHRLNIPGFIKEEVGLGDVFKHITYAFGIKPCSGCQKRAAALNRWFVFSPRR